MAATIEQIREIIGGDAESLTELERLADENEGSLTPDLVLTAATPEDSVLHKHFEWDDSVAAVSWRKSQARALIRSFELHVIDDNGERRIKYYSNVVIADEHAYRRTEEVLKVDALREQRRIKILRELGRIQGELAQFESFAPAAEALNGVIESLKPS